MKLGASVIPHFHVILTAQSISKIILFIQGHLQGQFQGQVRENIIYMAAILKNKMAAISFIEKNRNINFATQNTLKYQKM